MDICGQLHLFNAMFVLDTVIKALIERYAEDGDGYVQSEIDLVMQKIAVIVAISRSADEAASGTAYLFDGQHYAITSEYLVLDPVLSHACYTRYCSVDERTAPVIQSGAQFLKLINEEPYFVKYAPHAGMGGGVRCCSCRCRKCRRRTSISAYSAGEVRMQTPASSEHFQRTGIDRYPVLTPFVPQGKKPFKSKVRMPSLCVHNQWYKLPFEPDIGKSVPAVGAAPHYICMSNLKLRRVTSKKTGTTPAVRAANTPIST